MWTVSCGHIIKEAVTARSRFGLMCKEYVSQNQPGRFVNVLYLAGITECCKNKNSGHFWGR